MGAMPPTPAITFSTRTSWAPVARSTITARPMTMAQPPAKPWTKRAAIITAIVGASAHTTDASAITTTAAISSAAAAPLVRDRTADQLAERHADEERRQVSWTWVAVADRSLATCGNAGTYMSVASGAIAVRNTTVATRAEVSRARFRSPSGTGSGRSPRYSQSGQ